MPSILAGMQFSCTGTRRDKTDLLEDTASHRIGDVTPASVDHTRDYCVAAFNCGQPKRRASPRSRHSSSAHIPRCELSAPLAPVSKMQDGIQMLKTAASDQRHSPLPRVFFCERLRSSAVPDMIPIYQTIGLTRSIWPGLAFTRAGPYTTSFYAGPCAGMVRALNPGSSLGAAVCP